MNIFRDSIITAKATPVLLCEAVISDANGRVLLTKRSQDSELIKWGLPGGVVHMMESLEVAIVRVLHESHGILVWPHKILSVVEHLGRIGCEYGEHTVSVVYAADLLSQIHAERQSSSSRAESWHSRRNLPTPMTESALVALGCNERVASGD
ncbi:NUDIX domain-containing protein [Mesorhizobium sp. AR07]|uniref:NUDIX domain-containing protein n=1 Tax=Mesorhizobium sp. AR07 TaxID=2865838 RepID=UPI00215FE4B1|nr:NUDIX domain-containing protein [Mesorhizobium sp. AR07]UVK42026.1 NUDIX domain-containing protein [Mesorhizobium sp. AR07]